MGGQAQTLTTEIEAARNAIEAKITDDLGSDHAATASAMSYAATALALDNVPAHRQEKAIETLLSHTSEVGDIYTSLETQLSVDDLASLRKLMIKCYELGWVIGSSETRVRLNSTILSGELAAEAQQRATRAAAARADPVREAAAADIVANRNTSQNACANRVAAKLGRETRSVCRIIAPMFTWRDLPGGRREKRPLPELLADKAP